MERNKPYRAFDINEVECHHYNYIVPIDKTRILYDGRYCAVAGFIYSIVNGKYCVLANRRGEGTPDYQGYWNCPCGFLERGENSQEGISRETLEECKIEIPAHMFSVAYVQTEPKYSNNGNVSIHHKTFINWELFPQIYRTSGEKDEVEEIKWIPVREISQYKWAFNHERYILKYAHPRWKRKLLCFLNLIFG